jgi:hypothetical protein
LTLRQLAANLNDRGIASPNGGRFHANSERRIVTAQAAWKGAMAKGIQHYHKKLRRKAINKTTARHVAVEEHPDDFMWSFPKSDQQQTNTGYHLHSVSWQRYVTLKEGISEAEIAFDSSFANGIL